MSLLLVLKPDNLSIIFMMISSGLIWMILLMTKASMLKNFPIYSLLFILLWITLIIIFLSSNLLMFYIFFEITLIPMSFLILVWGGYSKLEATLYFCSFTIFGAIFFLLAIMMYNLNEDNVANSMERSYIMCAFFLLVFAMKTPMMPFHLWLPEAHAEAPTGGSVLLAGILLKLGTYGFLRFAIPLFMFNNILNFFLPLIYLLCMMSIVYGSLTVIKQMDLKKMMAYSSMIHMNSATLALFMNNNIAVYGGLIAIINHSLVASLLFFMVGSLDDSFNTSSLKMLSGFINFNMMFTLTFFFGMLANFSFPLLSTFIGEVLILVGLLHSNSFMFLIILSSIMLNIVYLIWLMNKVMFMSTKSFNVNYYVDLTRSEVAMFMMFIFLILYFGIFPNILINFII